MDNISHACVGHSLSPTHHDGRFFTTTYLGPYGIKLIIEKIAFQYPMKCKDRNLIWEDGSLHVRSTKIEDGRRHPQMIEWMWMMSKKLGSYLQIYDTGQQEAWLCWLLLKEFGHHLAYNLPKGMGMEKMWYNACIIEQKIVWMHGFYVTFISFIMSSSHELYDESMRRQQTLLLLGFYMREQG